MLEVEGMDSHYGRAQILRSVSLSLRPGQVVALLGRNGAGKSTTLKSIMGLVRPRKGSVRLEGKEIAGKKPPEICRMGMGYVPEERRIFPDLTVAENLEVGNQPKPGGWTPERLFGLFPNLRERQGNLGSQLSGGEQQMLTIARTLMGNPRVILLDEPSEGIAPVIVQQMAKTITMLKRDGIAVLLSEQNHAFARSVSDYAYIIEKGEIRYHGTMADLDSRPEVKTKHLAL